jgi:hypothetical protein
MNDSLIFLVLVGIALLFRWLAKVGGQSSDEVESPPTNARGQSADSAETDEERIRRFLEALGAPPGTAPPPKVKPRSPQRRVVMPKTAPEPRPPKRSWAQPLPPLVTVPGEPPPLPPMERMPKTPPAPRPLVAPISPAGAALVKPITIAPRQPVPISPSRRGSLGALLRSPASVRQAILLREVLGPPRGLQPFAGEI